MKTKEGTAREAIKRGSAESPLKGKKEKRRGLRIRNDILWGGV